MFDIAALGSDGRELGTSSEVPRQVKNHPADSALNVSNADAVMPSSISDDPVLNDGRPEGHVCRSEIDLIGSWDSVHEDSKVLRVECQKTTKKSKPKREEPEEREAVLDLPLIPP